MNKEFFYISLFNNKHIGDDGAFIDGNVYASDAFCEDVHFKRAWMSLEQIAKKAILVNVSDAIAMNATPRYALVTIAMPKDIEPCQMEEIAKGLKEAAAKYSMEIVGGDTVAAEKLHFSITIVAKTEKPLYRKPVKEGYLLAYTVDIGTVGRDLKKLLRGGKVSKNSKFIAPKLRYTFMQNAHRHIKAAMDISDGLFDDLEKLAKLNKIGFRFFREISKAQGCSGEEYELLFAFEPHKKRAIQEAAKRSRTKVTIFAQAVRGKYKNICKPKHF